jgi:hypothetical protein
MENHSLAQTPNVTGDTLESSTEYSSKRSSVSRLMKVVSYDCIDKHHLIARCPECDTGITMITCKDDFNGIAKTNCSECNKLLAFYVIMAERKAWMLGQPIEMVTRQVT